MNESSAQSHRSIHHISTTLPALVPHGDAAEPRISAMVTSLCEVVGLDEVSSPRCDKPLLRTSIHGIAWYKFLFYVNSWSRLLVLAY